MSSWSSKMRLETLQDRKLLAWWANIPSYLVLLFSCTDSKKSVTLNCVALMSYLWYHFTLLLQVPPLFLDVRPDHFILDSKLHLRLEFYLWFFFCIKGVLFNNLLCKNLLYVPTESDVQALWISCKYCSVCGTWFKNISVTGDDLRFDRRGNFTQWNGTILLSFSLF